VSSTELTTWCKLQLKLDNTAAEESTLEMGQKNICFDVTAKPVIPVLAFFYNRKLEGQNIQL
jgi:hypothetical protein